MKTFVVYVEDFGKVLASELDRWIGIIVDELNVTAGLVQTEMKQPGSPVSYPIQWDSRKQQNYVMEELRKSGNLPYQRTEAYQGGWKTERLDLGASLSNVISDSHIVPAHAPAAIGGYYAGWQSKVTKGRWNSLTEAVHNAISTLLDRVLRRLND